MEPVLKLRRIDDELVKYNIKFTVTGLKSTLASDTFQSVKVNCSSNKVVEKQRKISSDLRACKTRPNASACACKSSSVVKNVSSKSKENFLIDKSLINNSPVIVQPYQRFWKCEENFPSEESLINNRRMTVREKLRLLRKGKPDKVIEPPEYRQSKSEDNKSGMTVREKLQFLRGGKIEGVKKPSCRGLSTSEGNFPTEIKPRITVQEKLQLLKKGKAKKKVNEPRRRKRSKIASKCKKEVDQASSLAVRRNSKLKKKFQPTEQVNTSSCESKSERTLRSNDDVGVTECKNAEDNFQGVDNSVKDCEEPVNSSVEDANVQHCVDIKSVSVVKSVSTDIKSEEPVADSTELDISTRTCDEMVPREKFPVCERKENLHELNISNIGHYSLDDISKLGILDLVEESEIPDIMNEVDSRPMYLPSSDDHNDPLENNHVREGDSSNGEYVLDPVTSVETDSVQCKDAEPQNSETTDTTQDRSSSLVTDIPKEDFFSQLELFPNYKMKNPSRRNYSEYVKVLKGRYFQFMTNPVVPIGTVKYLYWYLRWQESKKGSIPAGSELKPYQMLKSQSPVSRVNVPVPSVAIHFTNKISSIKLENSTQRVQKVLPIRRTTPQPILSASMKHISSERVKNPQSTAAKKSNVPNSNQTYMIVLPPISVNSTPQLVAQSPVVQFANVQTPSVITTQPTSLPLITFANSNQNSSSNMQQKYVNADSRTLQSFVVNTNTSATALNNSGQVLILNNSFVVNDANNVGLKVVQNSGNVDSKLLLSNSFFVKTL